MIRFKFYFDLVESQKYTKKNSRDRERVREKGFYFMYNDIWYILVQVWYYIQVELNFFLCWPLPQTCLDCIS